MRDDLINSALCTMRCFPGFFMHPLDIIDSMDPREFISPSSYDVLLSDVTHELLLGQIAEKMEIEYLSFHGTQCTAESSTKGILFGANARPMVNLKIASTKFKKFVNIIFLVDTGSPCLYVCEKAMIALGFSDHIPMSFDVLFNNLSFEAVMSPLVMPNGEVGHYKDINLIGATFLSKARAKLIIDYKMNEVIMEFS